MNFMKGIFESPISINNAFTLIFVYVNESQH